MNADGSQVKRLFEGDPTNAGSPDWSPDGKKLVFSGCSCKLASDLWTAAADGSGLTQLTDGPLDVEPAWSPDGSKIAFVNAPNAAAALQLYQVNSDGSGRTQLASDPADSFKPSWQPIPTPTPTPAVTTTLTGGAAPGATQLLVAGSQGFAARDEIAINPGGANEEYSVVNALGSLDLAAPLQFAHSTGEHVVRVATNIKPGDADCSGTVDVNDAISVLRRAAAVTPYDHCVAAGNAACLHGITARDALDILLHVANVGMTLPVGCPSLGP